MTDKKKKKNTLHAVGRRKTARCTVNMQLGEGESTVNGVPLETYFPKELQRTNIAKPFAATNTINAYHFAAKVSGGGREGQSDALMLAIARSLAVSSDTMHVMLAAAGLLTRDPRAKERKKVFFVRARKKPQYSKR